MKQDIIDYIRSGIGKKAFVFGSNIGADILKTPILRIFTGVNAQVDAIFAFHERFNTDFLITAMDLSVEAECFGSEIVFIRDEAPRVDKRLVVSLSEIEDLDVPSVGAYRSRNYIEAAHKLLSNGKNKPVIGGIIGPFSLAGRLFGARELFELTIDNEFSVVLLIEKCTQFLINFAKAYKEIGCQGVVISEPSAGLLSPNAASKYSSIFIKQLVKSLDSPTFRVIYHNCGARNSHLDAIFQSCASILHFGEPMNILEALQRNVGNRIISGNLDPVNVFLSNTKEIVFKKTFDLFSAIKNDDNFLIAPGCDLPSGTPLENIESFYSVVHSRKGG